MMNPRYKRLEIEWKHFAVGDATCERCGITGEVSVRLLKNSGTSLLLLV
jgi:hypothetical protein